jgi:hypothetical protein
MVAPVRRMGLRRNVLYNLGVSTPIPSRPKPRAWIAYRVSGTKAALLGHVQAATMEAAIAVAAAVYRVPASRIIVQPIGH